MPRLPKLLISLLILAAVLPAPARAAPEVLPAVIVRAAVANRPEDYELTIETDRKKLEPEDSVTFSITFSNRGGLPANDVEVASWWEFTTDEFLSYIEHENNRAPHVVHGPPIFDFPERTLTWLLPKIPSGKTITFKFTLKVKPTHAYAETYRVSTRASLKSEGVSKEAGPIDHTVDYKTPQPPVSPFVFETKNPKLTIDKGQLTVDFQRIKLISPELPFSKIKMYPAKNIGIDIPTTGSPESDSGESASEVASLLALRIFPESDSGESASEVASLLAILPIAGKPATPEDNKSATSGDKSVCQFNIDGHLVTGLVQAGTCSGVINTPKAIGFYEVLVRLTDPASGFLETKLFNLEIVRRPRVRDEENQPISEAEVTLYRFNPAQNKFEVWNTAPSHQENPTGSDEAGEYEFVVPQGKYYLSVKALGFKPHAFEWFEMSRPGPITRDLTLKRAFASKIAHLITKIGRCITLTLRLIWESLIKIPFFRLLRLLGGPLLLLLLIYLLHLLSQHLGLPPWLLLPYAIFLLKKQAKPWGWVIDSENGQPIPGVRIRLRGKPAEKTLRVENPKPEGLKSGLRALEATFTNQQGKFGFNQPPGRYIFEIFKRGYAIDTEKQSVNAKPVIVTEKMVMLRWDGETELKILLGEY